MATKDSLQAREADCKTLDQSVALAREAIAEPADTIYACELLDKAEMQCHFPLDCIIAEAAMQRRKRAQNWASERVLSKRPALSGAFRTTC